jgi:hypothetical protein
MNILVKSSNGITQVSADSKLMSDAYSDNVSGQYLQRKEMLHK